MAEDQIHEAKDEVLVGRLATGPVFDQVFDGVNFESEYTKYSWNRQFMNYANSFILFDSM